MDDKDFIDVLHQLRRDKIALGEEDICKIIKAFSDKLSELKMKSQQTKVTDPVENKNSPKFFQTFDEVLTKSAGFSSTAYKNYQGEDEIKAATPINNMR